MVYAKENVHLVGRKLTGKIILNVTYGHVKVQQSVRIAIKNSSYFLNVDFIYREITKTNYLNVKNAEGST